MLPGFLVSRSFDDVRNSASATVTKTLFGQEFFLVNISIEVEKSVTMCF